MESSVLKMPWPVRRRLRRVVQQSRDAEYARRCAGVLTLYATGNKVGLEPRNRGREDSKATASVLGQLDALVRTEPTDMGYLRTGWSSELLALELSRQGGVNVHATTIQRWLARLYIVWRRARPTLRIVDPRKAQRLRAIRRALRRASATEEVF